MEQRITEAIIALGCIVEENNVYEIKEAIRLLDSFREMIREQEE